MKYRKTSQQKPSVYDRKKKEGENQEKKNESETVLAKIS